MGASNAPAYQVVGAQCVATCRRSAGYGFLFDLPSPLLNPPGFVCAPCPPRRGSGASLQWAAKPFKVLITGNHTHFRKHSQLSEAGRQTRRCSRQLPTCFGRIACKSNPTHRVSPSWLSSPTGASRLVQQEVPRLDKGYCATWRHCLCKTACLSTFRRFQRGDVP